MDLSLFDLLRRECGKNHRNEASAKSESSTRAACESGGYQKRNSKGE